MLFNEPALSSQIQSNPPILRANLDPANISYYIQQCFICRPSDSNVPTDAGIEPRPLQLVHWQTDALNTRLDLIQDTRLDLIQPAYFTTVTGSYFWFLLARLFSRGFTNLSNSISDIAAICKKIYETEVLMLQWIVQTILNAFLNKKQ